jgi:hypothetical protein
MSTVAVPPLVEVEEPPVAVVPPRPQAAKTRADTPVSATTRRVPLLTADLLVDEQDAVYITLPSAETTLRRQ